MLPIACFSAAIAIGATAPAGRLGVQRRAIPPAVPLVGASALIITFVLATDRAAVLLSACVAGATTLYALNHARAARTRTQRIAATATYLGHLVASLRAGSTLPAACIRAAGQLPDTTPPELSRELNRLATHVQAGGAGAALLNTSDMPELRDVGALWQLSSRLGIPVADLLDSARTRMDHALRHHNATKAALAGPRATAVVLSALPIAGVLMGQAMGAKPLALLTGGGIGGILLLVGTALVSAGFLTSQAIIGKAAA